MPVRVIDAQISITTTAGTRTGHYRLLTTLIDPRTTLPPNSSGSTTSAGRSRPPTWN